MQLETLGEFLRRKRIKHGLTLKQTAELTHINFVYISEIETGKKLLLKESTLAKFAKVLDINFDELVSIAKITSALKDITKYSFSKQEMDILKTMLSFDIYCKQKDN